MILTEKQQRAVDLAASGKNVFITGPGGVGKSVVVNMIRNKKRGSTVVVAPTGIAALNIDDASTIHKTFLLPFHMMTTYNMIPKDPVRKLFEDGTVKTLIIDEISMVRADIFVAMDKMLQSCRKNKKPFGGIQVIAVGDFYQLSPVLIGKDKEPFERLYSSVYSFDTDSWRDLGMETIELTEVMRQDDVKFISLLQSIRTKDKKYMESLYELNEIGLSNEEVDEDNTIFLCSTNKDADNINTTRLYELDTEEYIFDAEIEGEYSGEPAPKELALKVGCRVLILLNGTNYVNGSRGEVMEITKDIIFVKLDKCGNTVSITKNTWTEKQFSLKQVDGSEENIHESEVNELNNSVETGKQVVSKTIGTYKQFPLKLGYACTVHKSQGCTFDSAIILNGRGFFAHGQLYVALSRIRSLAGLGIMNVIQPREVIVDREIVKFYKDVQNMNLLGAME